jgi:curved DNA-binding protein CbpA
MRKASAATPWLIQWVAAEAFRMILCDAVVNVKKDQDEPLYNRLWAHCRNEGISFPYLQDTLLMVARSLGLVISETQVNFYELLGVPPDVDTSLIRKAYRQKAYDMHPDTRKDGRTDTAEFISLGAAYETLNDPVLRAQYDQSRRNIAVWKEESRPASCKRNPRRLKPVYQLAWLLLFLVVIAYIFDMIYRENALTTGYQPAENDAPVSKKIENIPLPKKRLVPGDLSDLYGPLASDFTRKNPPAEPPLPEIPLFSTGFEKKLTSSQPSIGRNKSESEFSTDIGVNKKEVSISKKPEIVRTSPKSEKIPLKEREFIIIFDQVQVSVHGLSLRKSPRIDGKTIREMAKGESGRVIGGPMRVDGFIWWALKLQNGDTGWATEKKVSASTESTGELVQMIRALPRNDLPPEPKPVKEEKKTDSLKQLNQQQSAMTPALESDHKKELDIVQKPPYSKTLQSFLDRYCETYEKRNLKAFSPLFTADATENGEPLQDLWPIYRRTFQTIDRIDYTIKLLEHAVELHTRTIHLKGRFNLKWRTIADGGEHESTGSIEMVLIQDQEKGFLVKQMKYRYQS